VIDIGVGGQCHDPTTLPPGHTQYPGGWWTTGLVWTGAENLAPTRI